MYLCTPKSIGKLVSNDLGVWRSPVSAPALGAGGHKFESCYPDDQKKEVLSRAEFPFDASARSPFDKFSGCSAARLARQLRELEVPSSNLGIPTNFLSEPLSDQWLFCLLFFHRIIRRFYRHIEYFPSENLEKSRGGVNLSASIPKQANRKAERPEQQSFSMEKASLLTCFATAALFSLHFLAATAATNDANAPASLTSVLPSDNASAEMVHERHTTAYYFNQVSWFDCNAEIFEDTSTGDSWIKIFHNGYKKGRVVSNPDYNPRKLTGVLNRRLSSRYMTTADNGMTYYFN